MKLFGKRKKSPEEELRRLIGDYELQSFSAAVMNTLTILRDPEASIHDIADQIEMDPGMHVKVLRLVNSVSFGLATRVSNMQHAATLLGRSRLESMVLSFAVTDSMPTKGMQCMDPSHFWIASARRASLARTLALHVHSATQAECFTAGLLQDMAVPLLTSDKKEDYCAVLEQWHNSPGSRLDQLENEAFGYSHATIGALMAENWNLPEYLINAIAQHHDLAENETVDPAIRMVSIINYSTEMDGSDQLAEFCQKQFQMDEETVQSLTADAYREADGFSDMFR